MTSFFRDGSQKQKGSVTIDSHDGQGLHLEIDDPAISKRFNGHSFSDVPNEITAITFFRAENLCLNSALIDAGGYLFCERPSSLSFELSWMLIPVQRNWSAQYSSVEFVHEFYKRLRRHYDVRFLDDEERGFEGDELALHIRVRPMDLSSSIETELTRHRDNLQRIHDETISFLVSNLDNNSLAVFFNFPDSISVACEQYLLYFGEFLKDLGVQVKTTLTHDAGQVLFTVTPADRNDALEKIRTALELYLKLPSTPITDTSGDMIAVQRLESTVLRLRSDLKLAAAELQAKDATIKAQNLMIGILNGEVLVNSINEITPKPEDKEDIISGIVALSTYKEKGVEINLGELFRRIKKFLTG